MMIKIFHWLCGSNVYKRLLIKPLPMTIETQWSLDPVRSMFELWGFQSTQLMSSLWMSSIFNAGFEPALISHIKTVWSCEDEHSSWGLEGLKQMSSTFSVCPFNVRYQSTDSAFEILLSEASIY